LGAGDESTLESSLDMSFVELLASESAATLRLHSLPDRVKFALHFSEIDGPWSVGVHTGFTLHGVRRFNIADGFIRSHERVYVVTIFCHWRHRVTEFK
jgi:hypothetical protein